jgi:hypothetical protein
MTKMLFITTAKGGPGKTMFAHDCWFRQTSWRYPQFFAERTPQQYLRTKAKWKSGTKTIVFRYRR